MALKQDIIAAIQAAADASGDLNLRSAIGAPGNQFLINGVTTESGQGWSVPGYSDAVAEGIATVMAAQQATLYENILISAGETSLQLSHTPKRAAGMASGYVIRVFRDGLRLRHVSNSPSSLEYTYNSATNSVGFAASPGSVYVVDYEA